MKCCEATLINFEVQYHCIMYFKMNGAPYGNILICISLDIMTVIPFCLGKQYKEMLKINVVYLIKISHFCISRIFLTIRFVLNELLYNSSTCRFHRQNYNKD